MWIHDMINTQDLNGIRQRVTSDNVHTHNINGETPIEYMVLHYQNRWKSSICILILAHLINAGADKSTCMGHIHKCLEDPCFDTSTRKFYRQVLKVKASQYSVPAYKQVKRVKQEHQRNIFEPNVAPKRSQYTAQERLQLEKMARSLGIPTQENHLATKIIHQLIKNRLCVGCTSNSIVCKECLHPDDGNNSDNTDL